MFFFKDKKDKSNTKEQKEDTFVSLEILKSHQESKKILDDLLGFKMAFFLSQFFHIEMVNSEHIPKKLLIEHRNNFLLDVNNSIGEGIKKHLIALFGTQMSFDLYITQFFIRRLHEYEIAGNYDLRPDELKNAADVLTQATNLINKDKDMEK